MPPVDRLPDPVQAPAEGCGAPDYADAFEIQLTGIDERTAEQWARSALEDAPLLLRRLIVFAHRHVLRLRLGSMSSTDRVLGWEIRRSEADAVVLAAEGPLIRALIFGRRPSPTATLIETFVYFDGSRVAAAVWKVVSPLHRAIASQLLKSAARSPSRSA